MAEPLPRMIPHNLDNPHDYKYLVLNEIQYFADDIFNEIPTESFVFWYKFTKILFVKLNPKISERCSDNSFTGDVSEICGVWYSIQKYEEFIFLDHLV